MQINKYLLASFLSSLSVTFLFLCFTHRDYSSLYLYLGSFIFGISFFLISACLYFVLQFYRRYGLVTAAIFAFIFGGFLINFVLFLLLGRIPKMDGLSLFYSFFGAGAGVLSLIIYLIAMKCTEPKSSGTM
ncbi:hypothetical protein [Acidovorax sp. NCPPB 3576]|uniref:hypothetical protein n=1 Tax=Acidovorax sp. NCPPB 3576 TaxID=2940488 RepID=UPI00234A3D74|nr:hypothetical protein [Acidovorax sp. NCPPB 3576]WCM87760.1 hypothetical protein M5C98_20835 [Acidovorax sp. NCPPB 3576]